MEERDYTLAELAEKSGVPTRTIRFYIHKNLLPKPSGKGPRARYSLEHFHKLLAVRRLKDAGLSLKAISGAFEEMEGEMPKTLIGDAPEEAIEAFRRRERMLMWSRIRPASAKLAAPRADAQGSAPRGQRSDWERIALSPYIELHARRPLPANQRRALERLLEAANRLFGEAETEEDA